MRKLYFVLSMGCLATGAFAQSAIDAYRFSQPDLRGTARFMGMGGAFGALGGDLSTLSQNPAGIGVYRSNELGFTLDLDVQKSTSDARGLKTSDNQTKFYLDNIGGVATIRLGSSVIPNLNFGFTYNKAVSFNRRYKGSIDKLQTSMSNYIAGIANNQELTVPDVETTDTYDPYNPNDGGIQAPWLAILGYDSYLINPKGNPNNPSWMGQFGDRTSGKANFDVTERGSVDEYNIAFGGNISNVVYWGMNFDIINFDYRLDAGYGEDLTGAYVYNPTTDIVAPTDSRWRMRNAYRANGTGFNYQLGVIVKPIQELRLGLAFHTPTSFAPVFSFPGPGILLCPHISDHTWYRNFNLLSIDYVFRPRLRSRLTQGRSALPWNPWIFGQEDSHLFLATHSGILSSQNSTVPSSTASLF